MCVEKYNTWNLIAKQCILALYVLHNLFITLFVIAQFWKEHSLKMDPKNV